jgi:hypothetical protein
MFPITEKPQEDAKNIEARAAQWAREVAYPRLLGFSRVNDVRHQYRTKDYDVEIWGNGSNRPLRVDEKALGRDGSDLYLEFIQSIDHRDKARRGWWDKDFDAVLYMMGWLYDAPCKAYWIPSWPDLRCWVCDELVRDPSILTPRWCLKRYGKTLGAWFNPKVAATRPDLIRRIWPASEGMASP